MELQIFNPWWKEKNVPAVLVGRRRRLFRTLSKYVDLRQMLILSGMRRVGKITLLFQIIDELLREKRVEPCRILYYSFDEEENDVLSILRAYEEDVLKKNIAQTDRIYLFFDEVRKLKNWEDKIKTVYDLHPNAKLFLSGSAAIHIRENIRESLAGRFFDFVVDPLDFDEFRLRKYFREGLLERVVYRDLPGEFPVNVSELLLTLLRICAERPGMVLDYRLLLLEQFFRRSFRSGFLPADPSEG
jgi:hypothetical protein